MHPVKKIKMSFEDNPLVITFSGGNEEENIEVGPEQARFEPLRIAAANGKYSCLPMLINLGADVNAKGEFGCTALHLAAKHGNYMCLKILLEAGADCCARIHMPLYRPGAPYVGNSTPLHLAAQYGSPYCIEELIKFGANRDAINQKGQTSLLIAARAGYGRSVLTLLKNSHGLACLSLPCHDMSDTPLHYAIKNRMVKCIKEMVHLGCNVNHINKFGFSPLHNFILTRGKENVDMEILKYLVLESCNTDINVSTSSGDTALDLALFKCRDKKKAIFLIAYGGVVNTHILKKELEIPSSLDILKCLVYCMPQQPLLKSINVRVFEPAKSSLFIFRGREMIEQRFVLVKLNREMYVTLLKSVNVGDPNPSKNMFIFDDDETIDQAEMYIKVIRCESDIIQERLGRDKIPPQCRYALYHLRQPVLDIIYERVIAKLEEINNKPVGENYSSEYSRSNYEEYLLVIKKQLWYERIASEPPTLQQCCRFSIRKLVGSSRLKYIKNLPLPKKIISYLTFNCGD